MEGLIDFGEGLFSGGTAGYKMSGGNPAVTAASALGMGAMSYFGGARQRRTEAKNNRLALAGMEQDLELGEMDIAAARRKDKAERDRQARMKLVGQMLGEYFQRKRGA